MEEGVQVRKGKVYYYDKTKEELAEAVVERRLAEFRAFREELDRLSSPKERLLPFVERIHRNRAQLAPEGCPLAGPCTAVPTEGGPIAAPPAALFPEPIRLPEA